MSSDNNVIQFTLKTDDKASAKIKRLAKIIGNVAKGIAKLATVALAAATAVIGFTKIMARAQDQAGKFAFKIGKSVEQLTAYQFAADLSGIKTETFNMAVQRMERRLGEAAQGTGEALSALRALGIEAKSFADLPLDVQLETLGDKFAAMESGTLALKTAFKLFDSEGVAMLQLLKQGSPAMRKMADEAARLGLVVSKQAAANSAAFNDSLIRLQGSITGASRAIAELLMPILAGLATRLSDFITNNKDKIALFFKNMISGFILFGKIGIVAFNRIKKVFNELFEGDVLEKFVDGAAQAFIFIAKLAVTGSAVMGNILLTGFTFIWDSFKSLGKNAWVSIKAFFSGNKVPSLSEALFKDLDVNTAKAAKSVGDVFSNSDIFNLGDTDSLSCPDVNSLYLSCQLHGDRTLLRCELSI